MDGDFARAGFARAKQSKQRMVRLSIQAWLLVKEYWGVYKIHGMDYKIFRKIETVIHRESRLYSYTPYIMETHKNLCPGSSSSNREELHKALAKGYKSEKFYKRMCSVLMPLRSVIPWQCVCGASGNTLAGRANHLRKVEHIIAIKSGKCDGKIIEKYKEDPDLFHYLDYCGFTSRFAFGEQSRDKTILDTTFNQFDVFVDPVLHYRIVVPHV